MRLLGIELVRPSFIHHSSLLSIFMSVTADSLGFGFPHFDLASHLTMKFLFIGLLGLLGALAFSAESSSPAFDSVLQGASAGNPTAVVVGGGPVGLATALTLAHPPHNCRVTVLEQSGQSSSQTVFDPTRAYLYNINPRGLVWFDRMEEFYESSCPHLESPLAKLVRFGFQPPNGMPQFVTIPGDPEVPVNAPVAVAISREANVTVSPRRNFWIPRHVMVQILEESCLEFNREMGRKKGAGSISLLFGKQTTSVTASIHDNMVHVHCKDGSVYTSNLVVAADGIDSSVRQCLSEDGLHDPTWLHQSPSLFKVKRYKSPSSGLRLRALQFPPNMTIPNCTSTFTAESTTIYSIRGKHNGPRNRVFIGFLPVKDPNQIRPGNLIFRPNHELASIRTGPEMKAWMTEAFPRLCWDNLVSEDEWIRCATSGGSTFPFCQYSPGKAVSNGNDAAVVLVGDACHAFPPDIGEGINAGIQDVVALDQAMKDKEIQTTRGFVPDRNSEPSPRTLVQAVDRYQTNRRSEHRALIRLARFGSPYQYRQAPYLDRIGRFLWTLNIAFRMILNKLSFGKIPPAAMVLAAFQSELTYLQVMRQADRTVVILRAAVLVLSGVLLRRLLL